MTFAFPRGNIVAFSTWIFCFHVETIGEKTKMKKLIIELVRIIATAVLTSLGVHIS